jgi:hypothetical protein
MYSRLIVNVISDYSLLRRFPIKSEKFLFLNRLMMWYQCCRLGSKLQYFINILYVENHAVIKGYLFQTKLNFNLRKLQKINSIWYKREGHVVFFS